LEPVIREREPCTLNDGNCPGIYVTESALSASIRGGTPSANGNPPIKPETPERGATGTRPVHGCPVHVGSSLREKKWIESREKRRCLRQRQGVAQAADN